MNRKVTKKKSSLRSQSKMSRESGSQQEECQQAMVSQSKGKSKANPKKKPTKTKSKDSLSDNQSQQNILQFRHGDEVAKDHIIPSFIRRWDGTSNQLEIFQSELEQMTPMLQAYWRVKCKHMNTVIMVEVGREFMVLENDALRLHEIFKKKLIKFSKFLMVCFWGREKETAKKTLFDLRVPLMVMTELNDPEFKERNGVARRQITEVITPALHFGYHDEKSRSRLMMGLYREGGVTAAVVLDSESNQFFVEILKNDGPLQESRRIINKYRPVQLLLPRGQRDLSQAAKKICNPCIFYVTFKENDVRSILSKFLLSNPSILFIELEGLYNKNGGRVSQRVVLMALEMVWQHLQSLKLLEKVFFQGIFHSLGETMRESCCSFDSQVYQNLQIFMARNGEESSYGGKGSLIGFLDKTRTLHGRKLLHKWVDQPLVDLTAIRQRQEAVRELIQTPLILVMHQKLDAYSNLERRLGDIYHWVRRNSESGKLILTGGISYEKDYDLRKNPAVVKLTEIMEVLRLIKEYKNFLKGLRGFNFNSSLLNKHAQLVDIEDIHRYSIKQISELECLPDITYVADIITRRLNYDELTGFLEPIAGQSEVFDTEKKQVERVNDQLQEELIKWKEYFQCDKVVLTSFRARNEIQVPKTAISKASPHKDLIFSSQVANATRYVTHETSQLTQELISYQRSIAQAYQPFLQEVVLQFCSYKLLWDRYLQSMGTLDVLLALAQAAKSMPVRCMPSFTEGGLQIKDGLHVNLLGVKEGLVANSAALSNQEHVLLLTGPNMGGKSTFLKQVCTLAVLAQMGSYIPASSYRAPIFDQIFCRMGASDRINQGKSTFYVQLEQTKRILSKATARSLVAIDQLGRGTSTFDGMAIAESVLECLVQEIRCQTLFSTHYTQISEQYSSCGAVKMMKMGHQQREDRVFFTYQLIDGVAERSFATNIARLVGIPREVVERAQKRSQEMHSEIHKKKLMRQACRMLKSSAFHK